MYYLKDNCSVFVSLNHMVVKILLIPYGATLGECHETGFPLRQTDRIQCPHRQPEASGTRLRIISLYILS